MTLPNFEYENNFKGKIIAGVDEVGRGALAGPVIAGAVILSSSYNNQYINDSKKISSKLREKLSQEILENNHTAYGIISNNVIDEINILQATRLAMIEAIKKLPVIPDIILVDGREKLDIDIKQVNIIRGDQKSISIASASIIAKVKRDKIMNEYHELANNNYHWNSNKGYGSKQHIQAIYNYGVHELHRKSFNPISSLLNQS